MGDSRTSLVNTRISLAEAPEAAWSLYRRLVDLGAINAELRDDVALSLGLVFPVRNGFPDFDAAIERQYRPRIYGVEIEVTGHVWRNQNRVLGLVKDDKGGNGLFFNFEGSFVATCPACQRSMEFGEPGSEFIGDAFNAWCAEPEKASMKCPACEHEAPIRAWRSANNTFAAGHLGLTLWGCYVTTLFEKPPPLAGTHLRHLIGDFAEDYAVVFCHI